MEKLGMFSATQNGRSFLEMLDLAKQMGFTALELYNRDDLADPDLDVARAVGRKAAGMGMEICCLSMAADLMAPDQDAQVERVKDYIRVTRAAGAPYIHFTTFPVLAVDRRGEDMDRVIDTLAPAVRELCAFGAEHRVCCVLEGQGYYINGVEPLDRLVSRVDHPNLGIVADLGNTLCVDERPEDFVAHFAPLIRHVHIKDMVRAQQPDQTPGVRWVRTRGGSWIHRTDLGRGVIDIAHCLQILADVGYRGFYSIENSYLDRLAQAQGDREYLKNMLDRIAVRP